MPIKESLKHPQYENDQCLSTTKAFSGINIIGQTSDFPHLLPSKNKWIPVNLRYPQRQVQFFSNRFNG